MASSALEAKPIGFKDLSLVFDTAPIRYEPQLEQVYQQRMNSKVSDAWAAVPCRKRSLRLVRSCRTRTVLR